MLISFLDSVRDVVAVVLFLEASNKAMEDNYRHKGMRKKLVEEVEAKGISDPDVLEALENVPRHLFLDKVFMKQAYSDIAFQIGAGQTISQPYTVAFQTELLQVRRGDKILEIGTGSGYQAAVLCELGARVYSIERQKELYLKASKLLPELGYNLKLRYGDGYKGWPSFAPYDKIIITCGAPEIPDELVNQLKIGGRMVIPVGAGKTQEMMLLVKQDQPSHKITRTGAFRFVPMLKDVAR